METTTEKELKYGEKNRRFFGLRCMPELMEVYNRVKDIESHDEDYEGMNMRLYQNFLKFIGVKLYRFKNRGERIGYIHKVVDPEKYDFGDGGLPDISKGLPKEYYKEKICPF